MGDDLSGTVLDGRYQMLEVLAEGGFGKVYVARQLNIDRKVAIKVMRSEATANAEMVLRFEAEAKIISELRHPNTLKLFDYGKTPEGTLYLVTELLSGRPLSVALERGPLDQLFALEIVREVCLSLDEAHGKGIVHRDLKPANIFLQQVGGQEVVKVLDFGVAKVEPDDKLATTGTPKTLAGTIIGTPAYMSPEGVDSRPIDGRSDLYSLGVVAYECLTGRLPFVGSPIAQIAGHGFDRPKRPSELPEAPPLDARVEALLMRLLEKQPEARPQSASLLADEIEALMAALQERPQRLRWIGPSMAVAAVAIGAAIAASLALPGRDTATDAAVIAVDAPEDAGPPADAGFDLGDGEVAVIPSLDEGWSDREAALSVLRALTPALLECYGLVERDPKPRLTVRFDAMHSGTTVSFDPDSDDSAKVRECFAFRSGKRIEWPEGGRASLSLEPKETP